MRGLLFGMAAMGTGGAAFWAGSAGPDFDRVIDRSPLAVYAAFSELAQEGEITEPATEETPSLTRRVVKVHGTSITVEFLINDRPAVEAELNFEPGPEGRGTRLTAEFDVDPQEFGSAFETEAGVALALVPDSFIDNQFAQFMDEMVDDIEAGRPLAPLGLDDFGVRRERTAGSSVESRRFEAMRSQREAVAPTARATPMVDPNEAARAHVRGDGMGSR